MSKRRLDADSGIFDLLKMAADPAAHERRINELLAVEKSIKEKTIESRKIQSAASKLKDEAVKHKADAEATLIEVNNAKAQVSAHLEAIDTRTVKLKDQEEAFKEHAQSFIAERAKQQQIMQDRADELALKEMNLAEAENTHLDELKEQYHKKENDLLISWEKRLETIRLRESELVKKEEKADALRVEYENKLSALKSIMV